VVDESLTAKARQQEGCHRILEHHSCISMKLPISLFYRTPSMLSESKLSVQYHPQCTASRCLAIAVRCRMLVPKSPYVSMLIPGANLGVHQSSTGKHSKHPVVTAATVIWSWVPSWRMVREKTLTSVAWDG